MSSNAGALDLIDELGQVLTRLINVDLSTLADAAVLESVRALRPMVCRLQAVEHRFVGAVHVRGAASLEGAVSTASWLRNRLHLPNATGLVTSAAALQSLPATAAAFAAGDINDAHVATIARMARAISREALEGGAEELLVKEATALAPTKFDPVATRIRDHLDPEAADRRRRDRLESRWLSAARTFDGCVSVSGLLDPEAGELLLATLGALMAPPKPDDRCTAATRRADALLDLCRLAADHTPTAGGEKPHVTVTIDLQTLRNQLATAEDRQVEQALVRGATLGSGWPIGPETVRRLACDAGIIPMVLGAPSQPLDVGRSSRTAPPALRRALVYRDGGCRFPGCDRPPEWTDVHHIIHWINDGPTSLDNCVLLCRAHHVQIHEHGWILSLDPSTGEVHVNHPDRRELGATSSPRGPIRLNGKPPGTVHRKPYEC